MELVVERDNVKAALKRVRQNKGGPGIDGMTVDELPRHLVENWLDLRGKLLAGTYQPKPVKRQEIPKNGGGIREFGIPCVVDRFIQQAILQVLQPRFDPEFSEHSYGFRPGRRAHDAVCAAQKYIQEGRRVVVDVDLLGWKEYFRLADTPRVFSDLDEWIRHRLRAVQLKQWKRGTTVFRELRARGISEHVAALAGRFARNWWRVAAHKAFQIAFPISFYDRKGLPRLAA